MCHPKGFRVSGTPSKKGWKTCYFFISYSQGWDFGLEWLSWAINNTPLGLSYEESQQVGCLKEISSSSCAIKNMTEWLIKVSINPTPRGMARARFALCFSLVCQLWLIYVLITFFDRDGEPQADEGDAPYLLGSPAFTIDYVDIGRTNPRNTT
ncbi:hypothetical protein B296_00011707 [Ensete ventricosum]|uniref:Uncharacterized protein n=1 Tax=Ensete ventricosum TaxID=4639 RepID=A0A426ZA31_ENSVE|nr:hypothetical protein B296_00011707 [Ensete ventricosum]